MKNIAWLASYPKSGNTWVRAFLTAFFRKPGEGNGFINDLVAVSAASRKIIEEELCLETSELTMEELENLRPEAMRSFAKEIDKAPHFIKVHDAYTNTPSGEALFPKEISIGVIYIVRNPLDVAVSFAHHNGEDVEKTISLMANSKTHISQNTNSIQLQVVQKLQSWDEHVKSWIHQTDIPCLLIKYEDMIADPETEFKKILDFCKIPFSEAELRSAINRSSFSSLQSHEMKEGFKEKAINASAFFRKGKAGSWRDDLTTEQANKLLRNHMDTMKELGYIDKAGNFLH